MHKLLTQHDLKKEIIYNEETGEFTRIKTNKKAGYLLKSNGKKYTGIGILSKYYSAHRIAWLYVYGEFPNGCVDHIDGNGENNSISNLR